MSLSPRTVGYLYSHIDKSPHPKGCWLWTGGTTRGGYGNFAINRKAHRVPRVMLHLAIGIDLYGPWIARHTCDNPPCCNPRHLVAGTQQQNVDDMWQRGRAAIGERMTTAKITEQDVRDIRARVAAGESSRLVSDDYPVSYEQVRRIARRLTWAHVV